MKDFVQMVIGIVGLIIKGIVLQKFWIWFVIPIFNFPVLTLPLAIGICLVVSMLTYQFDFSKLKAKKDLSTDDEIKSWVATISTVLLPLLYLLEGYIVTLFM